MRLRQIPQIPAVGKLLVSQPYVEINEIDETVILLFHHDQDLTTRGLIINKASDLCLADYYYDDFPELNMPIYYGGNSSQEALFCIHSLGRIIGDSGIEVSPGLFFESVDDKLMFMVTEKLVDPNKIRFIYGCLEWDPGQVLKEIEDQYWFIDEASAETIMKYNSLEEELSLWHKILDDKSPMLSAFRRLLILGKFSAN